MRLETKNKVTGEDILLVARSLTKGTDSTSSMNNTVNGGVCVVVVDLYICMCALVCE